MKANDKILTALVVLLALFSGYMLWYSMFTKNLNIIGIIVSSVVLLALIRMLRLIFK